MAPPPLAWPDADGKGLTVLARYEATRLWWYRDGTWRDLPWPQHLNYAEPPVKLGDCFYIRVAFTLPNLTAPQRTAMIRSKVLPAKPYVLRIGADGKAEEIDPEEMVKVGRYRIALKYPMLNDRCGNFYASCAEAYEGKRKLPAGALICNLAGEARYVPSRDQTPPDLADFKDIEVLVDGGRRAWTSGTLFDMAKLAPVTHFPDPEFRVVAAGGDGTAFALAGRPMYGAHAGRVMACQPAVPDSRKTLAGEMVKVDQTGYCIAGDGSLWASRGDFGVERFDGETWEPVADLKITITPHALVPAQNGWVFAYVGQRMKDIRIVRHVLVSQWFEPQPLLFNQRQVMGHTPTSEWLVKDRNEFLDAFSEPCDNRPWYAVRPQIPHREGNGRVVIDHSMDLSGMAVVVDKSKNIWLSSLQTLCVATPQSTLDVSIPTDGGAPAEAPRGVASIVSVGDGEYVFVRLQDDNSFFVRLTAAGDLDFSKGPKLCNEFPPTVPLRDHQGGIWLSVDGLGTVVRRMTAPNKQQEFRNVGEPALVDAAGCVWWTDRREGGGELVTIWAPGGETSTLKIPYRARNGVLVAGPKGHVFAATAFGLQECVAQDAGKPGKYSLGPVYDLAARDGERLGDLQYSGLGYLVASGFRPDLRGGIMLHLFSLTPAQPKDGPGRSAAHAAGGDAPAAPESPPTAKAKSSPQAAQLRTWKDGSGKFSIEAALVGVEGGKVTLRKADGSTTKVPLSTLSEADQAYVGKRGP